MGLVDSDWRSTKITIDPIKVEFGYPDNTVSRSKTNSCDLDDKFFGIDLPPKIGLFGVGLSVEMAIDEDGTYFIEEGIPITDFSDSASTTSDPYQLALLVVKAVVSEDVFSGDHDRRINIQ